MPFKLPTASQPALRRSIQSLFLLLLQCILMTAEAQVHIEGGGTTCAEWTSARISGRSLIIEHWISGALSGMSIASNKQFWTRNGSANVKAVVLWLDNYCERNPSTFVLSGADKLFRQQTGQQ